MPGDFLHGDLQLAGEDFRHARTAEAALATPRPCACPDLDRRDGPCSSADGLHDLSFRDGLAPADDLVNQDRKSVV